MKPTEMLRFRKCHPRRNLPAALSRKRGESNFVSSFSRAYINSVAAQGVGGKEFALSGFGIADFVWIAWRSKVNRDEASALSVEEIKSLLSDHNLTAFEMKLSDWRKGLSQAYRYSYFADLAVLVLPPSIAANAEVKLFRDLNIGLWSFDPGSEVITKVFTPRRSAARNARAKEKAMDALGRCLQLGQLRE